MKISSRFLTLVTLLLLGSMAAQAVKFTQPKREFRSSWVATVWCLDWPQEGSRGTDATSTAKMKQQLITLLDSLQRNNFNAVNFQVRSMCDAMYKSSIEPWSSYVSGTRGVAPGFDPLAMCVEECHKRGMECHAWVNPYRFSTGSDWNTAADLELKNNGWLLTHGSTIILDPGQQRTIDRIVAVCREIISNYDVDGILYDDYFYPNGIPSDASAGDYTEWQQSGTSLSIGDWRRDNVNRMVKAVYNMIQQTRPEVRFGISPAGVTCTSQAVADKHGVERSSGSDWQYNGIFSDPLAWYEDQSIDYMSPQIYWSIGYSAADYGKLAPWWNKVAKKFGRHMFVSHSISSLTRNSYGSENPEPSMTSSNAYDEFANQVELMRTTNEDAAPGSIYYSTKYIYNLNAEESFGHYLKRVTYQRPALPPAMPWKTGNNPGPVTELALNGDQLSWTGHDNVRYTVYAFPVTLAHDEFARNGEYLLGISYANNYTIPADKLEGYQYAVCVLDRVGNEYDPVILGDALDPMPAPTLLYPENGASLYNPFDFVWASVPDATGYVVEVAIDASFDQIIERVEVPASTTAVPQYTLSSAQFTKFTNDEQHYWRVLAKGDGRANGVSERRAITPQLLVILSPYDGQQGIEQPFYITWNVPAPGTSAKLVIATDDAMTHVVYTTDALGGVHDIAAGTLNPGSKYYVTATLTYLGLEQTSPVSMFQTQFDIPKFVTPAADGLLYSDDFITVERQSEASSYVVEVSSSATTWGRTRFVETLRDGSVQVSVPASEVKVSNKLLVDGTTYYARAKLTYLDEENVSRNSEYCPTVAFVYKAQPRPTAKVGDVNGDGEVDVNDVNTLINIVLGRDNASNYAGRANVDGVGDVDVSDVNALINIVLGK